jgi:hypothetical protein
MLKMCTDMETVLQVKGQLLTTTGKCQQILVKPQNIKFNENLCSDARFVTSERERRGGNRHIFAAFNVNIAITTYRSNSLSMSPSEP